MDVAQTRSATLHALRTAGHAGLAANYHEQWQLALDLNQSADSRRFHKAQLRGYARQIFLALEANGLPAIQWIFDHE